MRPTKKLIKTSDKTLHTDLKLKLFTKVAIHRTIKKVNCTGTIWFVMSDSSKLYIGTADGTFSLYDYDMSTYSTTDSFNHGSAEGFIDIYSLPSRIQAKKQKYNDL